LPACRQTGILIFAFDLRDLIEMDTVQVKALVDSKNIVFLQWLIESYDGIAIMRTLDAKQGLVEFYISPDFTKIFKEIIESLDIKVELL